jgi:hypothetical protein
MLGSVKLQPVDSLVNQRFLSRACWISPISGLKRDMWRTPTTGTSSCLNRAVKKGGEICISSDLN